MNSELPQNHDDRVKRFLENHKNDWKDLNISGAEGKVLYDLILMNEYREALEIGTSTGHSGIWIAWALSKTGGKLITIEISEQRYRKAVNNFQEAGLADFIDVNLGDGHKLVPDLEGPFDFVFCDADKMWYKNYLVGTLPKIRADGCFTAHNVLDHGMGGIKEFLEHLESMSHIETVIDDSSRSGISISYKRAAK
jgi:predicted O-methyltransferase YrrM